MPLSTIFQLYRGGDLEENIKLTSMSSMLPKVSCLKKNGLKFERIQTTDK